MPSTSRNAYRAATLGQVLIVRVEEEVDAHMKSFDTFYVEVQALRLSVIADPASFPPGALAEIDAFIQEQKAKLTAFLDETPIPPGGQGDQALRESLLTSRSGSIWEVDELVSRVVGMLGGIRRVLIWTRQLAVADPGDYPPDAIAEIDEVGAAELARVTAFRDSLP